MSLAVTAPPSTDQQILTAAADRAARLARYLRAHASMAVYDGVAGRPMSPERHTALAVAATVLDIR